MIELRSRAEIEAMRPAGRFVAAVLTHEDLRPVLLGSSVRLADEADVEPARLAVDAAG